MNQSKSCNKISKKIENLKQNMQNNNFNAMNTDQEYYQLNTLISTPDHVQEMQKTKECMEKMVQIISHMNRCINDLYQNIAHLQRQEEDFNIRMARMEGHDNFITH